ncbi:MAG: GTPase Era [Candidatus Kapabacteria bacterium]|nr:GTPase Era [Candidatus Kapabacteria bacterium]MDW7997681.1 GTPase Era [Bacteroidota bacterium]MDW8224526.1 GTPase Era [Bacteroidota bacterium]
MNTREPSPQTAPLEAANQELTRAGSAAIIGKPNVGKSTLLNTLLGTKLAIVTPKPQTTRKRVIGIYTDEQKQIIFFDTPGILEPRYELHRAMMGYVLSSLKDADVVVLVVDVAQQPDPGAAVTPDVAEALQRLRKPLIVALNKIDLLPATAEVLPIIERYAAAGLFREFVPLSALKNTNVDELLRTIEQYLPPSPFLYDPQQLSTQPERFFVSELIREHVFLLYHHEVPYSTEVQIVEFKERDQGKWYIAADIIVERETHKGILIGSGGQRLKALGQRARQAIEAYLGVSVYLELIVKVRGRWRNNKTMLHFFGY